LLYRVRVGRDDYLGTAEEVVAFMMRAEGAPGADPQAFMDGVAARLGEHLGVNDLPTSAAEPFLLSLAERRIIRLEQVGEPHAERTDPRLALGDGPVVYGEGVSEDDLPV